MAQLVTDIYKAAFGRLRTWPFWRNMIVYFCVFSLIGHLIEWPYCAIGAAFFNSVDWSDEVLANPLKPFMVYGIGIVMCAIFLAPFKDDLLARRKKRWQALLEFFVLAVILGMIMELVQGFTQNQPVDGVYPLWDVHDYPGNILGQAWIVNDLFLGAVFTFATWHIYPMCEKRIAQIPPKHANKNCAIIAVGFIVLVLVTYGIIPIG